MSSNPTQPTDNLSQKPPPKRRRKKDKPFSDMLRDFLERTGLNEDFEAAVAHVTRYGIDSFWKNFKPVDVSYNLPPGSHAPIDEDVNSDDPYTVLGVHRNTPPEIIRAVYMAWVKNHHPDVGGDSDTFKKINVAYDQIKKEVGL